MSVALIQEKRRFLMNLQKSAAEKTLRSASNNKYNAVRIDKDSTLADKTVALKELVKDVEKLTRKNQSVTIIVVSD